MRFSILPLLIAIGSVRGDSIVARLLQGDAENVTAAPPFDDDTGNQTASDGTDKDSDTVSSTPWRVQPKPLPDNFKLTASFYSTNEDSKYAYTVAVAGEVASITSHTGSDNPDENDPTLYFENYLSDKYGCNPANNEPTSFMTSKFQVFNKTSIMLGLDHEIDSTKMCWKAPAGHYISQGNPFIHKMIFQMFILKMKVGETPWMYDGTVSTIEGGKADVWNADYRSGGRATVYLARSTGEVIKYVTRFGDQEIVLEFTDFSVYDEPDQVPNASLTDEQKESCYLMSDTGNFDQCPLSRKRCEGEGCQEDLSDLIKDLKDAYSEEVASLETGLIEDVEESSEIDFTFDSTGKDYEMKGSEEEQAVVNGLKSFQPGMVGRKMLKVRNQSNCGSCYSFAASHTITSSYAQENPGPNLLFSNQHLMNCLPLNNGEGGVPQDGGTGCWGGDKRTVINMIVYLGGKVPLLNVEPYLGFQSHCNLEQEMVDTGITGYSPVTTVEEMKNALYFRGDVAVSYDARDEDQTDLSGEGKVPLPDDNIELHEQAFLGEGISYPYPGWTDHAVAVVGWGPCQVTHCKTNETITDECWIMQNSWGRGLGWDGFYFIHSDPDCDGGIVSSGRAIIPLYEKEEKESATVTLDTNATKPSTTTTTSSVNEETSGGTIKSSFILFAAANIALFVMFA